MFKYLIICITLLFTYQIHTAQVVELQKTISDPSFFCKLPEKEKTKIIKSFGNQSGDALFFKVHKTAQTSTYIPYSAAEKLFSDDVSRDILWKMAYQYVQKETCVIM